MGRSRISTRDFFRLLGENTQPIYVLDRQRKLVYCNPACEEWLNTPGIDLIGVRCDYHADLQGKPELSPAGEMSAALDPVPADASEIWLGLCPPPDLLSRGRGAALVACRLADGTWTRRRSEFLPLSHDDMEGTGVIGVVESREWSETDRIGDHDATEAERLHRELIDMRRQLGSLYGASRLVGCSPAMAKVRRQVKLACAGDSSVLLLGPDGSGREHLARTIGYGETPETAGPLITVDCRLTDAEMIQAAVTDLKRNGGEGGALLLLEVDRLPIDAQLELAGFLQLPGFSFRMLCTANQALDELASAGQFDAELASALGTLVIELPPLCQRPEDVPQLAQVFLEEINARGGRQLSGFSPRALDLLAAYAWPGNVDQLWQVVEQSCEVAEGPLVDSADLPAEIGLAADTSAYARRQEETIVLDDFLAEIEAELIRRALRQARGNKTRAAEILGISRPRLHRRVDQLGLDEET